MDWKDKKEIAKALDALYPELSINSIPESEMIEKVTALPGFTGEKQPPDGVIKSIINNWKLENAIQSANRELPKAMLMDWKDAEKIGKEMLIHYPGLSLNITDEELIEKVVALPGFIGEKQPPDKSCVGSIIYHWSLEGATKIVKGRTDTCRYEPDHAFL